MLESEKRKKRNGNGDLNANNHYSNGLIFNLVN